MISDANEDHGTVECRGAGRWMRHPLVVVGDLQHRVPQCAFDIVGDDDVDGDVVAQREQVLVCLPLQVVRVRRGKLPASLDADVTGRAIPLGLVDPPSMSETTAFDEPMSVAAVWP